jgi:Domain of unknown function (DUF4126)
MHFTGNEVLAIVVGASFAAGLNVYATVATLGLLSRFQLLALPPALHMVSDPWVIGAAGALFLLEFVADKIPAFDLIWNALHTFVRIPIAALLGYGATAQLSPEKQLLCAALAAGIALAAHGSKIAVRAAVTPSPEPVSNMALSLGEDGIAIGLTWFATVHPYIAAAFVAVAVVVAIILIRLLWRAMRSLFRGAQRQWTRMDDTDAQPV